MTPQEIALSAAKVAARNIGESIVTAVNDRIKEKREHPYVSYKYHEVMSQALPKWRFIARAFHRARARHFSALWQAGRDASTCRLSEARMRVREDG